MRKAPRPASAAWASFLKGFCGSACVTARLAKRINTNLRDFTESSIQVSGGGSQIALISVLYCITPRSNQIGPLRSLFDGRATVIEDCEITFACFKLYPAHPYGEPGGECI